jgi:hypothetical protein
MSIATWEYKLPIWTGVVFWTVVLYSDVFSESVRVQYYKCQPPFLLKYVSWMGVAATTSVIMPTKLPKNEQSTDTSHLISIVNEGPYGACA